MTFERLLTRRIVGRLTVAALACGVLASTGLAIWSINRAETTLSQLHHQSAVHEQWHQVFLNIVNERMTLRSYMLEPSETTRSDLASVINSAGSGLEWLEQHGSRSDAAEARAVLASYGPFTSLLRQTIATPVRTVPITTGTQTIQHYKEIQQVLTDTFERIDANRTTHLARISRETALAWRNAVGIGVMNVLLCLIGALILIAYQRRSERAAADSLHLALHDSLTGLPNRALLSNQAARAIADATGNRRSVGLLLIDLDRFKLINDTVGHQVGDEVLREVANRLRSTARESDLVARLGGDEFAVLLREVSSVDDVRTSAERFCQAINGPLAVGSLILEVEASVGTAVSPNDAHDAGELVKNADVAMYRAKRSHLKISGYSHAEDLRDPAQLSIPGELRTALHRNELVLHYQPKVGIPGLRPAGVEALVRWLHPERGLLPPGAFLPMVEPTDVIEELTDLVLDRAAQQMSFWAMKGLAIGIAVNVPPRCLLNNRFPDKVAAALATHGADPHMLTVEVTESALITVPELTAQTLRNLSALGVQCSIDDFGTGYSSLSSLCDLPVQELKTDRKFVGGLTTDDRHSAIVELTIHLARRLGLLAVAEGVEDESTLIALGELGCPYAQGYHIGRPMPADECEAWVLQHSNGKLDFSSTTTRTAHSLR